ncbi:MAG TPA: hypothetical protein VKU41_29105, partial [Polyangiaceae bacterium]|nr:hypothetical protein [Polyangiaceae bacterium]
ALEEIGGSVAVQLGRCTATMTEPEWYFLTHQQFDGLGGLAHVLRTVKHVNIDLPTTTEKRPSWPKLVLALLRSIFRVRTRAARFRRPIDESWKPPPGEHPMRPSASAWTLFTRKETAELRLAARRRGVSLNVWLFWALKEMLRPELAPGGNMEWVFPISMRGAIPYEKDTDNQAFSIELGFRPDATPEAIESSIRREMRRGMQWLGPWLIGAMRFLTPAALKRTIQQSSRVYKTGSYTNLGARAPAEEERSGAEPTGEEEWWMAFGVVLKTQPVGMVCLTWRGCMSVTLRIHPALSQDRQLAEEWLATWRRIACAAG